MSPPGMQPAAPAPGLQPGPAAGSSLIPYIMILSSVCAYGRHMSRSHIKVKHAAFDIQPQRQGPTRRPRNYIRYLQFAGTVLVVVAGRGPQGLT